MTTQLELIPSPITMSVGRDRHLHSRYEYVLYQGDMVLHRDGFFSSYSAAKRAGIKAAAKFAEPA